MNPKKSKAVKISMKEIKQKEQQVQNNPEPLSKACSVDALQFLKFDDIQPPKSIISKNNNEHISTRAIDFFNDLSVLSLDQFKQKLHKQGLQYMQKKIDTHSRVVQELLSKRKTQLLEELSENAVFMESEEDIYQKVLSNQYSMEIAHQRKQAEDKKNFRERTEMFNYAIEQVNSFILNNSRIISDSTIKQQILPIYNQISLKNEQIVRQGERQCDKRALIILANAKKLNRQRSKMQQIKKMQTLQMKYQKTRKLAKQQLNFMQVLITPFHVFCDY